MNLDETYVGTKWTINEKKYPKYSNDTAIITNISDGIVKYGYYYYDSKKLYSVGRLSIDSFVSSFVLIDKNRIISDKIDKIKANL